MSTSTPPRWLSFLLLLPFITTASAQKVTWLPQHLQSGSPVFFTVDLDQPATEVRGTWLNQPVAFAKAEHHRWYALAGIDVEQQPGLYTLQLTIDGRPHSTQIAIKEAAYRTTTLHVQEKFVTPDAATLQQIAADKAAKDAAYSREVSQPLWSGSFHTPVPFAPTDSFGTRRMFNGKLASIHRGTDFHAPPGTPVVAANDGVVLIAQPMFYEGNLVVIDHGQQFSTLYMHLSKIQVRLGEHVTKGQRLGLSGATGRVTGPHLHFAARWHDMYVDAVMLLRLTLPARQ